MTPPLDPHEATPSLDKDLKLPHVEDRDPNQQSIRQGLDAAENDLRDAVADAEEESARQAENPEANLDDIQRGEDSADPAELAAMKIRRAP